MSSIVSNAPHQPRTKRKLTRAIELLKYKYGGERGIRTLDTLLTYTPLAGARLQPLGHFSVIVLVGSEYIVSEKTTPP